VLSQRTMMIISQLYIIILAYAFAAFPRYVWLLFLIYLGLMIGLSTYSARSSGGVSVSRQEIERARQLLREENALQLAMEDEELLDLYSKQMKASMISFAIVLLYLPLFWIIRGNYQSLVDGLRKLGVSSEVTAGFIIWLSVFEAMTILNFLVQRRLGLRAGKSIAPMVPKGFIVTDKGIMLKGSLGKVIGFPLPEGTKVTLNEERNYVEIEEPKGGKIRLYTMKARRLYEIITRYGLRKEQKQ
jgi:uncharacterized membrane protein